MRSMKIIARNTFTSLVVVLQVVAFPVAAFAEDVPPSSTGSASTTPTTQTVEPAPAQTTPTPPPATPTTSTAPSQPTTPPPDPYVLNKETGNYENSKYSWNPSTQQTTPKTEQKYSYNPVSGVWETPKHAYDPVQKEYVPNVPVSSNMPMARTSTTPTLGTSTNLASAGYQSDTYDGHFNNYPKNISSDYFGGFYNAQISNNIYSNARSGDASITQNTIGGNALTGNARAIANLMNLLQTSFSPGGSQGIGTFVANIDGDVVGDIMIDPGAISKQNLAIEDGSNRDLSIDVENNGTITNNVDLAATSGNASVSKNTQAGNATTGTATAIANVVNMINSSVAAGQSFFGVVNINGNFNGDILMPPNALDYLLASSAPRTTVKLTGTADRELNANLTNNQSIANSVNANAKSGSADVSRNTQAGSAQTGNAETNVTILNLTGSNIIGANSLLVFVNVSGEWVGLIVDAPSGSTSAAYAGGVTKNGPLSGYDTVDINAVNNSAITNNINVNALSGDASVTENTEAGNARSGDAYAGVNLANIMNSNLSLSDWFGVLFINVFGTWHGSFGVDTTAGNTPKSNTAGSGGAVPQLVTFVPGNTESTPNGNSSIYYGADDLPVYTANFYGDVDATSDDRSRALLASAATTGNNSPTSPTAASNNSLFNWRVGLASLVILSLAIGTERLISARRGTSTAEVIALTSPKISSGQ